MNYNSIFDTNDPDPNHSKFLKRVETESPHAGGGCLKDIMAALGIIILLAVWHHVLNVPAIPAI